MKPNNNNTWTAASITQRSSTPQNSFATHRATKQKWVEHLRSAATTIRGLNAECREAIRHNRVTEDGGAQLGKKRVDNITVVLSCDDRWNVSAEAFSGPNAISKASRVINKLPNGGWPKYWQSQWGVMSTIVNKEWQSDSKIVILTVNSRNQDMTGNYPYTAVFVLSTAYVDAFDDLLGAKFCGTNFERVRSGRDKSWQVLETEVLQVLYPRWLRTTASNDIAKPCLLGQHRKV
jgi:hypothetical protein